MPKKSPDVKASETRIRRPVNLGDHSEQLRIVAFSDYRVQDIGLLYEFINTLNPRPDLILYGGDDTERFRPPSGINWFERLASLSRFGLCGVIGNDCRPSYRRMLRGTGVYNVHERPVIVGDYAVIGMEGAKEPGIGSVLYKEPSIRKHLVAAKQVITGKKIIILSHCPPHKVLDLAQRFGWNNIGSSALWDFVQKTRNVVLVVCGHVHRCGAQSVNLGSALVVNAASHDEVGAPGRVAIIEMIEKGRPSIEWRLIPELTSIPGVGETRAQQLKNGGIAKVEDLARAEPHLVHRLLNCGISIARQFSGRAQALVENKPVVLGPLQLPAGKHMFLDIETDDRQSYIWLIGVYSEPDGFPRQFFAESPEQEREILQAFAEYAQEKQNVVVLSISGSHFERRVIFDRLNAYGLRGHFQGQIEDIYWAVENCVALPIPSFKLKDVATHLGYQYRHPELSGKDMPFEYNRYVRTRNPSLRKKLLEYNEDDVMSLRHVARKLMGTEKGLRL